MSRLPCEPLSFEALRGRAKRVRRVSRHWYRMLKSRSDLQDLDSSRIKKFDKYVCLVDR